MSLSQVMGKRISYVVVSGLSRTFTNIQDVMIYMRENKLERAEVTQHIHVQSTIIDLKEVI